MISPAPIDWRCRPGTIELRAKLAIPGGLLGNQKLGNDAVIRYPDQVRDLPQLGEFTSRLETAGVLLRGSDPRVPGLEGQQQLVEGLGQAAGIEDYERSRGRALGRRRCSGPGGTAEEDSRDQASHQPPFAGSVPPNLAPTRPDRQPGA